jgi:dTMP kinase
LLDIDVLEGLRRRSGSGDRNRLDDETVSFHQRVATWYRQEAERDPERWCVIDGSQSVEAVSCDVAAAINAVAPAVNSAT